MQRYNIIEKVRSEKTQVIGILIGSVVVDNYMQIINAIKLSCAKTGKKYYEVLIGKLNEPKLKNFQFVTIQS
jgi:diphthamide biosynthesis enzyme Dph1/Dph2-like protein